MWSHSYFSKIIFYVKPQHVRNVWLQVGILLFTEYFNISNVYMTNNNVWMGKSIPHSYIIARSVPFPAYHNVLLP